MKELKQLCLERDANRCRHCGTTEDIDVYQLVEREGRLSWHLSNLISLCSSCHGESEYNRRIDRVGVILCGGKGSRLYPLTKFQNKHTLPIGLVPMLFYPIKTLRKFGVTRVLVVIDREGTDSIIEMLGSGEEFGMDISYKVQEGAGGIAEALRLASTFIDSYTAEIIVVLGDNVFDNNDLDTSVDLTLFDPKTGLQKNEACVYLKQVPNPEDYGIAVLDENNKVTRIVEKPKEFIGDCAVLGLYVYSPDVFDVIDEIKPSDRGELEISDVNDYYASRGTLDSKMVTGYWTDCGGSIQKYAEASVHGAKQANVSESEIRNFVSIVFDDK